MIYMKLALHSSQGNEDYRIDKTLFSLLNVENPKIAYIPSQSDKTRSYFNMHADWYKKIGITDFFYFDADEDYDATKLPELLSADAIYLSGGNTYFFLQSLQKHNLIPVLQKYVRDGGALIGISAGSILMSETIEAAALPPGDPFLEMDDYSALSLVDFDFYPHMDPESDDFQKVIEVSKTNNRIIYACKDGDGIIVDGEEVKFIGDVVRIEKGVVTAA